MKRANGEGSPSYNAKRNRYEFKISYYDAKTNTTKRRLFTSKKSVVDAKRKAKLFIDGQSKNETESLTVSDWLEKWLWEFKHNTVKPKTFERYESLVRCNINPYQIGNILLENLNSSLLQKHFNFLLQSGGMNQQGISPRNINSTRRLLIDALNSAVDNALISVNIATKTKPLKALRPTINILSFEEANRIRKEALKMDRHAWIIITLALGTGMRIAEIHGLEWKNINLDEKLLKVDKTVVTTKNGILIQDSTKTINGTRTIHLPDNVCSALKRYRLWQKVQSIRFGYTYMTSPWVISNLEGKPRSPSTFSAHYFKQILAAANVDSNFRIHDFRHTHATWLLSEGVNVKIVSERLGHSNIRITLDTYAHCIASMQHQAADTLNKIF